MFNGEMPEAPQGQRLLLPDQHEQDKDGGAQEEGKAFPWGVEIGAPDAQPRSDAHPSQHCATSKSGKCSPSIDCLISASDSVIQASTFIKYWKK